MMKRKTAIIIMVALVIFTVAVLRGAVVTNVLRVGKINNKYNGGIV